MKKLKMLGRVAIVGGFVLLFLQNIENFDLYPAYDDDVWPFIWRLGGRLVLAGVVMLAIAYYKESGQKKD